MAAQVIILHPSRMASQTAKQETIMPFGKFYGHCLSQIPDPYLEWLRSLSDLREPLRSGVAVELTRRAEVKPPSPKQQRKGKATIMHIADARNWRAIKATRREQCS